MKNILIMLLVVSVGFSVYYVVRTDQCSEESGWICPNQYASVENCNPILGHTGSPFEILLVNINNAPFFEQMSEDTINQFQTISPFQDHFESIAFYKIKISGDENTLDCGGKGTAGSLGGSGFACNNLEVYKRIEEQCKINDKNGIIVIAYVESILGGSGGDIIYVGSSSDRDIETNRELAKNTAIHEIGHNFGLADLYGGIFYFDGRPSSFWPTDFTRKFLNIDGPGCPKWCQSYKPVSEYTKTISSQCISFVDKDSCVSFGRESDKGCTEGTDGPACCVWDETGPFEYFESQCAPAWGNENIGQQCSDNAGCYFGASYGNYAWRPARDPADSIMYDKSTDRFTLLEEKQLDKILTCCLSNGNDHTVGCSVFREDYSEFLRDTGFKKRIGSCGYK